jgi:hypothetical protein
MIDPAATRWSRSGLLSSAVDGYRLTLSPDLLDVNRFDRIVSLANAARAKGNLRQARDLLEAALAEWRGVPFGGLTGAVLDRERARLEEQRFIARQDRLELQLELGQHEAAIPELLEYISEQPMRERPVELLMTALYRSGRQGEALMAYAQTRRLLAEELGVEPGESLQQTYLRILRADEPPPPTTTALYSSWPRPTQLPADIGDFVGRHLEIEKVKAALRGRPNDTAPACVAITGPPGIGKSALATHVGHLTHDRFPDGELYADLQARDGPPVSPGDVISRFLRALGCPPTQLPDAVPELAALYRSYLANRKVLLVLDNVSDADQVTPLLPGTPQCAVLLTSRARLSGLAGWVTVDLDPMPVDDALALVAAIVGADRVAREPAATAALAELCGRLPLAVRIASSRLAARPSWTVRAMCLRLDDGRRRLDELALGNISVRASFQLSYDQLTKPAARAFRLLSIVGLTDIGIDAAAALLGERG